MESLSLKNQIFEDVFNTAKQLGTLNTDNKDLVKTMEKYWELDEKIFKLLKKQKSEKLVQIVLSWLDDKLFDKTTGYMAKNSKNGIISVDNPQDSLRIIKILQTIKKIFKKFDFKSRNITISSKSIDTPMHSINFMLQALGVDVKESEQINISKFKKAALKIKEIVKPKKTMAVMPIKTRQQ